MHHGSLHPATSEPSEPLPIGMSESGDPYFQCEATVVAATRGSRRPTMLDLETDHLLSLSNAGRHLPPRRCGRQPHPSTLYRWAKTGLRGTRLETIRIGGTLCTSL